MGTAKKSKRDAWYIDMEKQCKKIEVCCGRKCNNRGAQDVFDSLKKEYKDSDAIVSQCSCLGQCTKGVNVLVDENKIFHYSNARTIDDRIKKDAGEEYIRYTEDTILKEDFLGDI